MKPDGSLTDLEMWSYWRDKCGHVDALEGYYKDILKDDMLIREQVNQILSAKHVINMRMQELTDEENKRNGWESY